MDMLQSQYSLKLAVFTQVANALESTKLQIARDTPIFSILNPVTIPNGPVANKRSLIVLFSSILGVVTAIVYILAGKILRGLKKQWNQV